MTEHLPLSSTSTDPVEQALLRSVRCDQPGPQALQRTAAALGISISTLAATTSSAGALASSGGAGSAVGAMGAAGSGVAGAGALVGATVVGSAFSGLSWIAVKAVLIGAMSGAAVLVGVGAITEHASKREQATEFGMPRERHAKRAVSILQRTDLSTSSSASKPQPTPTPSPGTNAVETMVRSARHEETTTATSPGAASLGSRADVATPTEPAMNAPFIVQETSAVPTRAQEGATQPRPLDSAESPKPLPAPPPSLSANAPEPTALFPVASSMNAEIAAMDRARQYLQRANASAALTELDDYRARWPHGVFALEAVVLRVQALLARGDRAGAERAARPVLTAQPQSRHAARLRALLESPKSSDQIPTSATGRGI